MTNENNLKVFSVLFLRASEKLKELVPVIVNESIFRRAFDILFDVFEPAYKAKLITNYGIECNPENNPFIQYNNILHAKISFQLETGDSFILNYEICNNFRVNILYTMASKV